MTDFRGNSALPRGIRNNNPGNLILTGIKWRGSVPSYKNTDKTFEQFVDYSYGVRAMLMDIIKDVVVDRQNTIRELITEYAPKHGGNPPRS